MSRTVVLAAAMATVVASLVVAATGSASSKTLTGTVGPDFTISLRFGAAPATKIKAGRYRLTVEDRSSIHDFHLTGPGATR